MRRIAILTQPLLLNYGGILQAYALQHFVSGLGYHVTTDSHTARENRVLTPLKLARHLMHVVRSPKSYTCRNIIPTHSQITELQGAAILDFTRNHINTTELFDSHGRATTEATGYDAYIVGSDQIWRPKYNDNIKSYFLDFLGDSPARRISYAASFGTTCGGEYTPKLRSECATLLKKFNSISVRESDGKRLCLELFDCKSQHVADPTLLLSREDYAELCAAISPQQKLLTSYILDENMRNRALVEEIATELNLTINAPKQRGRYPFVPLNEAQAPSMEQWLASFRDAELVVTDSFHGTIFAIIFERPFITIVNNERGLTRLKSLLKAAGLEDRLIPHESMSDRGYIHHIIDKKIDFSKVRNTLAPLITSSEKFLKKALE